ncbi:hypothetical protein Cs7R123_46940 [Catellatospora sp. TT07R-123]|uniref:hypothetical protein n=1 Tax=Catellatospora sp. TT07R-123 TaxID=2733863 RepID=UPI001B0EF92B|nr:hypothetical protein [Catellatospora sp. TT07R-123]GHJ47352.1 hypothetical protein Cs7R123_46940 [Catellatospora sp. TT07R-123]
MGIDYSFQVYVHRRDVGRLITAVAALCFRRETEWTTVALPDGTSVVLPATCRFEAGRTVDLTDVVAGRDRASFDLSLCFPQDGPLRAYRDDEAGHVDVACAWPDGTTRVRVGYVYLTVSDGSSLLPDHWIFDFTPATSGQSRLFLSSPSVRQTFATLALSVGGPLCLMDVEERFNIVVTAHDRQISTQVPGPCLLWDTYAPEDEAYRELLARLAGQPLATTPEWIVGPGHADYEAFLDSLTRNSQVTGAVH